MGVRTLDGTADGTTAAAAMYDSVSGMMFGPLVEGDDAADVIEGFLNWMRRMPFVRLCEDIGLAPADLPDAREVNTEDARRWPDSGLAKLIAYYRREAHAAAGA